MTRGTGHSTQAPSALPCCCSSRTSPCVLAYHVHERISCSKLVDTSGCDRAQYFISSQKTAHQQTVVQQLAWRCGLLICPWLPLDQHLALFQCAQAIRRTCINTFDLTTVETGRSIGLVEQTSAGVLTLCTPSCLRASASAPRAQHCALQFCRACSAASGLPCSPCSSSITAWMPFLEVKAMSLYCDKSCSCWLTCTNTAFSPWRGHQCINECCCCQFLMTATASKAFEAHLCHVMSHSFRSL